MLDKRDTANIQINMLDSVFTCPTGGMNTLTFQFIWNDSFAAMTRTVKPIVGRAYIVAHLVYVNSAGDKTLDMTKCDIVSDISSLTSPEGSKVN